MKRPQIEAILKDLEKKMVLLVGPRQVGKTYTAKKIGKQFQKTVYLNYDRVSDRKMIQDEAWLDNTECLILDELHKMPEWKNYLKGVYDTKPETLRIIVTGSARLDVMSQVGDSLAGRYFIHHLFPLSLAELKQLNQPLDLERLISHSGFPEPFLADSLTQAKRWRNQYMSTLLTQDIFDLEQVQHIKGIGLVFELLRTKVGSPISYQSLAEDAHLSPTTVKKYIQIFEALYIVFQITPYAKNIARSLQKPPKIYFFDTGLVNGDDGAKLENLIALSLLKHIHGLYDYEAREYTLHYLRTKEKKEVDFALIQSGKIEEIFEVKLKKSELSRSLVYFHEKYQLPARQIVQHLKQARKINDIILEDAKSFLSELYL